MSVRELEQVVREELSRHYEAPVVHVRGERVLVLGGKALQRARAAAEDAGHDDAARLVASLDLDSLPRFTVPAAGLRLWRQHGLRDVNGELVTELVASDPPIQIVTEHDGWSLLRTLDGAMGWVEGAPLGLAHADELPAPHDDPFDIERFVAAVEEYLGVPYRWGGTTSEGVDCSGLVQRAARSSNGWWLPRHSTQLMKVGRRVAPKAVDRGDVLVLRAIDPRDPDAVPEDAPHQGGRHPMHVAVATDSATVVHASRNEWRVVREPLSSLRERYNVLAVRRLGGS